MTELRAGMAPGLPEAAVRRIVDQADGIPLYAVETFRMLLDSGRLRGRRGRLPADRLARRARHPGDPPRAHRRPPRRPGRRTIGRSCRAPRCSARPSRSQGLAAVSELPAEDVEPRLRGARAPRAARAGRRPALTRAGPVRLRPGASSARSPTGRSARRDRRARHLAAARYYESLGDDELAGILASHYVDAFEASPEGPEAEAVAAQARVTLRGAADRAMALHSHDQAASLYRQALTVTIDPAERVGDPWSAWPTPPMRAATSTLPRTPCGEAIDWYDGNGRPGRCDPCHDPAGRHPPS